MEWQLSGLVPKRFTALGDRSPMSGIASQLWDNLSLSAHHEDHMLDFKLKKVAQT